MRIKKKIELKTPISTLMVMSMILKEILTEQKMALSLFLQQLWRASDSRRAKFRSLRTTQTMERRLSLQRLSETRRHWMTSLTSERERESKLVAIIASRLKAVSKFENHNKD